MTDQEQKEILEIICKLNKNGLKVLITFLTYCVKSEELINDNQENR